MAIEVTILQFDRDAELIRTSTVRHPDDAAINPRAHLKACEHDRAESATISIDFEGDGLPAKLVRFDRVYVTGHRSEGWREVRA